MRTTKKIEEITTNGKLQYIHDAVRGITETRIKAAIFAKRKEGDIQILLNKFSYMNNNFVIEAENLKECSKTHNKRYANKDNLRFTTEQIALIDIKRSITFLYTLVNDSKVKIPYHKRDYWGQVDTRTIDYKIEHSYIGKMPYSPPLFELQTECEQRLLLEIQSFLNYLDKCFAICENTIAEEKAKGRDADYLIMILEKQIDEAYEYVMGHKVKYDINCDYIQELLDYENNPEFVIKWFHQLHPTNLTSLASARRETQLKKYPDKVKKACKNDINKMNRFINVIKHIDDYEPEDHISGATIYNTMQFMNVNCSDKAFYEGFVEAYGQYGNGKPVVNSTMAISKAKKVALRSDNSSYFEFEDYMNAVL